MKFVRNLFFLAYLLLSGCASVQQMQNDLATSTTVPTASFAQMPTQALDDAKDISITLDKASPIYLFDGEKSYYAALDIAQPGSFRMLNFKSYFSSSYLPAATVLYPQFVFLDDTKQPISGIKSYRFEPGSDFFLGPFYEGNIIVPAQAKSLVIYTSEREAPRLESYSENGMAWPLPTAPAGKLALKMSQPYPHDYDFSMAIIRDSAEMMGNDRGNFFYVSHIDGKKVEDSRSVTHRRNVGRGFSMSPHVIDREVPIRTAKYTIVGRTEYAAPILALTNTVYEVKGEIEVPLVKDQVYEVQGVLSEEYSAVWLENISTHEIVGRKIEIKGPAKLGILQK